MTGYDQSDDEAAAEVEPGSTTEFWMNKIIAEKQAEAVAAALTALREQVVGLFDSPALYQEFMGPTIRAENDLVRAVLTLIDAAVGER